MRCRPGEFGGEPSCEAELRLALVGSRAEADPAERPDPISGLADADEVIIPPRTGCVAAAAAGPLRERLGTCDVAIMGQQWGGCSPAAADGQRRPTSC